MTTRTSKPSTRSSTAAPRRPATARAAEKKAGVAPARAAPKAKQSSLAAPATTKRRASAPPPAVAKAKPAQKPPVADKKQAPDNVATPKKSARQAAKLIPASPESGGKAKSRRKRLSKAFPMPLEIERKKARKQELKRVLKALQALADEGMVSGRYSLPGAEYAQFMELRRLLEDNDIPAKKNQLIRAGLQVLLRLPLPDLVAVLEALPDEPGEAASDEGDHA